MNPSTTIKEMMAENTISVPDYQRAYSWDTGVDSENPLKQVNTFFADLEEYNNSPSKMSYYFGHFLFEKEDDSKFSVIDGQQRLTTIAIFFATLFRRLKCIRELTDEEEEIYKSLKYRFSTVEYDNLDFKDYVIDGNAAGSDSFKTESAKRIVAARDYFTKKLDEIDENGLIKLRDILINSQCTTHILADESEAIQMFIFQNSRGKRPSNLEIIKAQFMFNINLYADKEKREHLINDVKDRFGEIYRSISRIEYNIDEDDVLAYTLRIYFNSLTELNTIGRINKLLLKEDRIKFIADFTKLVHASFESLEQFFCEDEKRYIEIHSLISLGGIGIALPFIILAYKSVPPENDLRELCSSLESLLVRHRLIGTRANINTRLNDVFREFTKESSSIKPVIDRIKYIKKTESWWWSYWNNEALEKSIQGGLSHPIARFLLWKYELHLFSEKEEKEKGYGPSRFARFDSISKKELEHIAPATENPKKGYEDYDEVFRNNYIHCLGNYLLLSKSHNCKIGNKPFIEKRDSYNILEQQKEVKKMTEGENVWTRIHIEKRKSKIVDFVISTF